MIRIKVVLSPGPGNPSDFGLSTSIDFLTKNEIPGFGVCLGLQGMVEHFGGTLGVLSYPMHGKPSKVFLTKEGRDDDSIFSGLPDSFEVARYHSLHGIKEKIPSCLQITASTENGIVMGIKHKTLPFAAVQFHPESILTSPAHGMKILENSLQFLTYNTFNGEGATPLIPTSNDFEDEFDLVGGIDALSTSELKEKLKNIGLSSTGTKSELVIKLTLWLHKSKEARGGKLNFDEMTVAELRELKQGLGLKGTLSNKGQLVVALKDCLGIV